MMEINLVDLKKIVGRLLDHVIEARGVNSIVFTDNFYWNVPSSDKYDVSKRPTELDIGSLSDDWEFLSALLNDEEQAIAYQLTELAPIIRCLGETLGRELAKDGG